MAVIKNIRLENVRSHTRADFQFVSTMNAIVGPNGSGKTSIIEALYTLLQGSSFKGPVGDIAQYGYTVAWVSKGRASDTEKMAYR